MLLLILPSAPTSELDAVSPRLLLPMTKTTGGSCFQEACRRNRSYRSGRTCCRRTDTAVEPNVAVLCLTSPSALTKELDAVFVTTCVAEDESVRWNV